MSNDAKTEAEAFAKLQEAATKKPWQSNFAHWKQAEVTTPCSKEQWDGNLSINGTPHLRVTPYIKPEDADFIAHARNTALPRLTLELAAENERLREAMRNIASLKECTNPSMQHGLSYAAGLAEKALNSEVLLNE